MKNASSLKSNKIDSPKTPGGISKALLTPCRRVGLSRNWKKQGPSPFVSPLSGSNNIEDEIQPKKRKTTLKDENKTLNLTPDLVQNKREYDNTDVDSTPTRNVDIPCRKKSKILLNAINNSNETDDPTQQTPEEASKQNSVVTPVRSKSIGKKKKIINKKLSETVSEVADINLTDNIACDKVINNKLSGTAPEFTNINVEDNIAVDIERTDLDVTKNFTKKSPNNLTRKCVVVIQNKIFKNVSKGIISEHNDKIKNADNVVDSTSSQCLFNSDTDDVPLANLDKRKGIGINQYNSKINSNVVEDENFIETKVKPNINNMQVKAVKNNSKKLKNNTEKPKSKPFNDEQKKASSQHSFDDDDDFEFENKKTILIRKSYDKVAKPSKAKSTGSITQRDIDELKARIEYKKKLLLTNALTEDTKELRDLIKKWQRGCQDALMELMDLMKTKLTDKQSYSELLQSLKIPSNLVGYDSENDCFVTPEDSSIILSQVNDL